MGGSGRCSTIVIPPDSFDQYSGSDGVLLATWSLIMTAIFTALSQSTVLNGINWATYPPLIHDLESAPSKRLTYDHGTLKIKAANPTFTLTLLIFFIRFKAMETEPTKCPTPAMSTRRQQ
jgi:hypothetical protein